MRGLMEILSGMDNCGMRGALQHPPQAAPHLRRRPLVGLDCGFALEVDRYAKEGHGDGGGAPIERRDRGEHITGASNSVR